MGSDLKVKTNSIFCLYSIYREAISSDVAGMLPVITAEKKLFQEILGQKFVLAKLLSWLFARHLLYGSI